MGQICMLAYLNVFDGSQLNELLSVPPPQLAEVCLFFYSSYSKVRENSFSMG